MPAPGLTFDSGPARVAMSSGGRVVSVVHHDDPALSYLSGAALGELRVDDERLAPVEPEVRVDVDEVEVVHTFPGRLRVVVRHTFATGWGVRLAFVSLAPHPQQVERAQLRLEPGPRCVAWALTLGVTGAYAVSPASGTGPLLGGLLRLGSVRDATPDGLELSPFTLAPDGRHVAQLQWDWYATPRAFGQERYGAAPSALFPATGEVVQVRVDDDVAVVMPEGPADAHRGRGRLELVSAVRGRFPVELRSARGTIAFSLQWVDRAEELLASLAEGVLSAERSSAGVVKLPDVAAALVVQHALGANRVDDPDDAAEALDLFTARLTGSGSLTPVHAAYLCREHDRLGDPDLLDEAWAALRDRTRPAPGLGLAATQLCLGLIARDRPAGEVLGLLSRLFSAFAARRAAGRALPEDDITARAAALELVAVTAAGPRAWGPDGAGPDVRPEVAGLGLHLGAGLKGQAVLARPEAELAHLLTVFQLLPDDLSGELTRRWGCSAHALAAAATPGLLARLEGQPVGDAHSWLVLGLQGG